MSLSSSPAAAAIVLSDIVWLGVIKRSGLDGGVSSSSGTGRRMTRLALAIIDFWYRRPPLEDCDLGNLPMAMVVVVVVVLQQPRTTRQS